MKKKISLKAFLILNLILIVIVAGLLVTIPTGKALQKNIENRIIEKNKLLLTAINRQVSNILCTTRDTLFFVKDFIKEHKSITKSLINNLTNNFDSIEMIQILDSKGKIIYLFPFDKELIGNDMSNQDYYNKCQKTKEVFISSSFISTKTHNPTVTISIPYERGFIVGFLNLNMLAESIVSITKKTNNIVGIVDVKGIYIAHTNMSNVYQKVYIKRYSFIKDALNGIETNYIIKNFDDEEVVISTSIVKESGWVIIIYQPTEIAFVILEELRKILFVGFIITIVMIITLASISLYRVGKEFSLLIKNTNEVASGNYNIFPSGTESYYEFSKLADNFKKMVDAVNEREKKIKISEEKSRKIIEYSPIAMTITDKEKNIEYLNRKFIKTFGYTLEDIPNINYWWSLAYPDEVYRKQMFNLWQRVIEQSIKENKEIESIQANIKSKDKKVRIIEITGVPVGERYLIIFNDITSLKQTEEKLKNSLKEKEVLLKEIHHRVKNNLQIISSLLRLQARTTNDEKCGNILKESQNRIASMALIHENLYQSDNFVKINFSDYINSLVKNLFYIYEKSEAQINLIFNIENILLEIDIAVSCGLIINELVTNSLKYAFPENKKGTIQIDFKFNNKTNKLILKISDNGVGLSENVNLERVNTLGLRLVNILVSQIEGEINFYTNVGTMVEIIFPYKLTKNNV